MEKIIEVIGNDDLPITIQLSQIGAIQKAGDNVAVVYVSGHKFVTQSTYEEFIALVRSAQ